MNAQFRGPCPSPEQLTAFVDGALGHDERDVVQTHLARCARCRADVAGERRAKRAVQSLIDPAPSPELLARLSAIAGPGDIGGPLPADLQAARAARDDRRAARAEQATRRRGSRSLALLSGAASVAVFVLGLTAFVGAVSAEPASPSRPGGPTVTSVVPAADRFAEEHAVSTTGGGIDDPALTTVSTSFVLPAGTGTP